MDWRWVYWWREPDMNWKGLGGVGVLYTGVKIKRREGERGRGREIQ